MLPYILLYLLVFLFAIIDVSDIYKKKNYFGYYVLLIAFTLFAGLRDMIGGSDIYIYAQIFEVYNKELNINLLGIEPGFLYFNYLINLITNNRYAYFFIISLVIFILHFKTLKKYNILVYLAIFIYFTKLYLMSFVYLRQFLGMGIAWLSIPYIIKRKFILFLMIILLATSFHYSALIFIIPYLVKNIKLTKYQLFILFILSILFGFFYFFSYTSEHLGTLVENRKLIGYSKKSDTINYFYLIEGIVISSLLIIYNKYFYNNHKNLLFFNLAVLYVFLTFFSLRNGSGIRFIWYYLIGLIYFLTNLLYKIKDKFNKFIFIFILLLYFSSVFFRILIVWDNGDFIPYKTIFQDFERHGRWEYMEY